MKTKILLALLFVCVAFTAVAGPRTVRHQPGTVVLVSAEQGWYGLVPDSDPGTRYAPHKLPPRFRVDGLRVVFSGRVGRIPPNVRVWGTPLRLTRIAPLRER